MSFQFRRRGDVREQSPQQEPFFQNISGQQPFVDTTVYPQMGQPQGYDPRFNNGLGQPNQPHQSQHHPQQLQNMQPGIPAQQQTPQSHQFFQGNNGNFYSPQQAGAQGNMQQQHPQSHMLNPSMGQAYGMTQPQMGHQQQHPDMMHNNAPGAYMHPVQASQMAEQKANFQGYAQSAQGQKPPSANYTPEDVRSLSFWQETQTNSGFEDPDSDEASNSPVRLLVAVAGVALIAGLSWFAYKWAKSPSSDAPPLIHAEPGPHKVSPERRGGINIPYQDKLIYDRIGDGATEEPAERLLPPPEKPSTMSTPIQQPVDQNQQNAPQQPMYSEAPVEQQNIMPGTLPSPQSGTNTQQNAQQQANVQQPANMQPQQPLAVPAPPQPQAAEIEPEIITKTKPTPTLKGNYFVQMATVKSEAAALREWKRLQAKHNLKGMKSQIKESETTDGEVVYRLLMGPFEEKVKALKYAVKIDGTKVVHVTE